MANRRSLYEQELRRYEWRRRWARFLGFVAAVTIIAWTVVGVAVVVAGDEPDAAALPLAIVFGALAGFTGPGFSSYLREVWEVNRDWDDHWTQIVTRSRYEPLPYIHIDVLRHWVEWGDRPYFNLSYIDTVVVMLDHVDQVFASVKAHEWAYSLQTELEKAGLKADLTSDGYNRELIRRMQDDLAPKLAQVST